MATSTFAGPVDYAVFAIPLGAPLSTGLSAVAAAVAAGTIELLDIAAVALDPAGRPITVHLDDLQEPGGIDMQLFQAARSDLLDAEDLHDIAVELARDQFALVIVYEDRSLAVAAHAFARIGGVEIFSGGVDIADLHRAVGGEEVP
ncbi:DUF6325 family protein [Microbacterium sp. LjRoot45]|uniref:hypothetical protein n=1 Tax=Microbacterium sp. LjRoot45 TaxID=3342329 RepID=UPI003ECD5CE9